MTENNRKNKSPNYFMIGMYKVLIDIFVAISFPLFLIVQLCRYVGGDPDVVKKFENMKDPMIVIFLTMFIWTFCFICCYGVASIVFGN